MRNLILAAHKYINHKRLDIGLRYEVLALTKDGDTFQIEHFEEAFNSVTAFGM
jgi:hypothetical protein